MAGSVRCCTKFNFGLLTRCVSRHLVLNHTTQRTIFDKQSLGLTSYLALRDHYKRQFLNIEDSFRDKMLTYTENSESGMIFTEDLKVMLHLMEKTPKDSEIIEKMLKKFNSQSEELRFGNYIFGPIVMRACHNLNDYDLALKLFNDPQLSQFFSQLTTYQILLDLLYCNKQYATIRAIYDKIQEDLTDGRAHPRNALIIVTAACYKENTTESLEYALQLWRKLKNRGYPPVRRVITHISALALKQNAPHIALEILMAAKKPRYIAIRCLKIMALVQLGRVDDVVPFFRASLERDDPNITKETYFKDTIEQLEAEIAAQNIGPDAEIVKLLALIKNSDMVQPDTLEDHTDSEISVVPQLHMRHNNATRTHQMDPNKVNAPDFIRKPGLRDLV